MYTSTVYILYIFSRDLYEALDSEEECIKDEEAKLNAVITIQVIYRQRSQKQ